MLPAAADGEVRLLLDQFEPTKEGWEDKVRNQRRCGLVKAVHKESGSFEWVEAKWKDAYEKHGPELLGRSNTELDKYVVAHKPPGINSGDVAKPPK